MRRYNNDVARKVTGKRPRGRPRLRWMDRVRSDLKQHQLDPNREAWRKAVMVIDRPRADRDKIGKGKQQIGTYVSTSQSLSGGTSWRPAVPATKHLY